jgi:hypothetical protein
MGRKIKKASHHVLLLTCGGWRIPIGARHLFAGDKEIIGAIIGDTPHKQGAVVVINVSGNVQIDRQSATITRGQRA